MITIPQRRIQTDGRTTCLGNAALRIASRGKKSANFESLASCDEPAGRSK